MGIHHLYIDDSGTKDYAKAYGERRGASKYFVYGGVLVPENVLSQLVQKIIDVKTSYFKTSNIEVKSTWIRNPKSREEKYLRKYSISEIQFDEFLTQYYSIIRASDLKLFATVIDKLQMQEKYHHPYPPCGIAYEFLLQRTLRTSGLEKLYVHIDNMTGKATNGLTHKQIMNAKHDNLRSSGSKFDIKGVDFTRLHDSIGYMNSAANHIIQVADIVAYNTFRQFEDHGSNWDNATLQSMPLYEYFKMLIDKFEVGREGKISGYGIVKYPTSNQPWFRR